MLGAGAGVGVLTVSVVEVFEATDGTSLAGTCVVVVTREDSELFNDVELRKLGGFFFTDFLTEAVDISDS